MRAAVIAVTGALLLGACGDSREPVETPSATPTINVGLEYVPAAVLVPQGQPLRLSFVRDDSPSCGDELVIPKLNIRKKIPAGTTTVVELPPQPPGPIDFACGMKMMKGQLVVR